MTPDFNLKEIAELKKELSAMAKSDILSQHYIDVLRHTYQCLGKYENKLKKEF